MQNHDKSMSNLFWTFCNRAEAGHSWYNWLFKGPCCDPIMLFLWHSSVDIHKTRLFLNLQLILMLGLSYARFMVSYCCTGNMHKPTIWQLFCQTNKCARNILHTNIMYLPEAFYWCKNFKISTFFFFWRKMGDDDVDYIIDLSIMPYTLSNRTAYETM